MVAGDRNEMTITLAPDSQVKLKQQSALKIYPSHNGEFCTQAITVELAEQARLEWLPEVIIPFERAQFQVNTTIRMKESSTLIWGERLSLQGEKCEGGKSLTIKHFNPNTSSM